MITEREVLDYLKENKPYLYAAEDAVSKIRSGGGYGEVSVTWRMVNYVIDKGSLLYSEEKLYHKRVNNNLT